MNQDHVQPSAVASEAATPVGFDAAEVPHGPTDFQWRVLSLLNGFRLLVVVLLLALFYLPTGPRAVGSAAPLLFLVTILLYLILAVGSVYLIARREPAPSAQVYLQVLGDILAIATLVYASGGIASGLGNLLVVPIGGASLLMQRRQVGVLPAVAAIALLTEYGIATLSGPAGAANSMSTGLLGATLFVVALAAQPLATRLRESEDLARRRGVDLANMAELNDYVIQHLRESLVVVDSLDQIRLINGAAMQSLDVEGPAVGRRLADFSPRLQTVVDAWREDPARLRSQPSMLASPDGGAMLLPQIAELGRDRPSALLIFLEDQSLIAERAQQSKLAALGRLSASIAHEIRNPVGAMSHAAQLLGESPSLATGDQRLTDIIHQNAKRISSIVDNVLQLSRPRHELAEVQRFALTDWVDGFAAEYAASHQLHEGAVCTLHNDGSIDVRMDPTHLHQVTWNLCDNALKYGAPNADGVGIHLRTGRVSSSRRPYLEVIDYGPGVEQNAVERMFEPFFTSHHGGTGLGLFIARQLCEGSGGALAYTPRGGPGAVFRVTFADPDRWLQEGPYGRH
ncbi:MAG: HAMP domain-containing sensor histidine kinase [Pseudomonadota bacterium]